MRYDEARQLVLQQAQRLAGQELKRSKLEAELVRVRADADAYAKRANASANKSLDAKLNAWVEANKAWANLSLFIFTRWSAVSGQSSVISQS